MSADWTPSEAGTGGLSPSLDKQAPSRPVAPAVHTIFLVILLLAFSYLGATSTHKFSQRHGRIPQYLVTMGWEWALVGYIVLGLRRRRTRLRDLVAGRWRNAADVASDIGVAFAFWIGAAVVLAIIGYAMGLADLKHAAEMRERIGFLVPRSRAELLVFLALSITAGFCEEIIFRGYFLCQFAAATRNWWMGVALQGVLFGASHAYEGNKRMVLIAIYGMMFGALALARRSLRPGMIAHALHDASAGAAMYRLLR
jgi:membrane protease YdiL (CAAX protease family)